MTRTHGLTRILAAALAIAAVAAPAAVARPAQTWAHLYAVAPINALGTDVGARDQQAPASAGQDLRSPDAADTSTPPSPQPVTFSPVQTVEKDATPWIDDRPRARRRLSRPGGRGGHGRSHPPPHRDGVGTTPKPPLRARSRAEDRRLPPCRE